MIDVRDLHFTEKLSIAELFLSTHNIQETTGVLNSFNITRENFDLFIIDAGLADDPETDNPRSVEHKGFVQQRSNARRALNGWASHLPVDMSFAVETHPKKKELYRVVAHADNAVALAMDVGTRIERFSSNKIASVRKTKDLLFSKGVECEGLDEFVKMSAMIEGYAIVMQRNIRAETDKFNKAMDMLDQKALEVNQEMDAITHITA